ncbi:hypothetical protein TWF569_010159 [Orbilia oligospora]|uniref:Uncharacterized protein n=1 Tax=Orbilia oligospora TaxID=2813651 RepID=A0A7C8MXH8_ORBOL|nr:hypothetical protein TWF103_004807 [Orbilia oligospora]KAF3084313.1 hypothetical protein TWF102_011960 [Orbilia oligospora]KAF3099374.1 hypothetical protein TWF706_006479 [Orbilia oligospora]KAF3134583.1 hypothetical protein TWF569_010159 [Orbilia oligospora]KAF3138428.1 hypothetical protein TWF594_007246 [Orbilia oligospora]
MDDDYDSGEDIIATSNGAITTTNELSRRKRKRAKREAVQLEEGRVEVPAKKLRTSPDAGSAPTKGPNKPTKLKGNNGGKQDAKGKGKGKGNGKGKPMAKDGGKEDASSIDDSIVMMDPKIMADFVAQRIQKFNKDLSTVELGDRIPSESIYIDTTAHTAERSLQNLCEYMEKFCTKKGQSSISHLKSSPKAAGSPHTIFICPAALRAADVVRIMRKYQTTDSQIAKFFAKHVKLSEHIEYAKKTRIGIAVGTPARLVDLIKDGALQIKYVQRVVLDVSYLDAKKRGLWDIKEVQDKLVELLAVEGVRRRLEGGGEEDSRGLMFY